MSDKVPIIGTRAITLKEAAKLLRVSYGTVYARRQQLGFFQIGSVWRIWPETLADATQGYNERRPAQTDEESETCQSESAKAATSGTLTSARQTAAALDKLLERPTARRRKNSTTN
ncbi:MULTISPECIES: helix-turn-helix domain-containing protein [unclassified Paraburkholderia]|uniref:helix-turn-helix domain-containing protein n=1 Tax=unclassified Paraburkholderia TaxID=2615204 RepID=UPI00182E7AE6|nr:MULTISPECIES: helix-turn-helix domain-containing protein [unclassified Paraburkholderia]MBB5443637.1 excisionase family DNA binding protein [Paraburkholderia sp. WSM4177]MBB5484142.1 excisionase family DNA binding protein [Paraburkholderia sp. WSM4180]